MIWALAAAAVLQTPAPTESAVNGPFKVLMLAVPDLDQLGREWAVQTEGAHITSTSRLVRNKPTFVVIFFGGCAPDAKGNCRIEVSHEVRGPDGKIYDGLNGSKRTPADVPVARADAFFAAPQVMGIRIEPGEALGLYQVQVKVTDLLARRTNVVRQNLTAVEAE